MELYSIAQVTCEQSRRRQEVPPQLSQQSADAFVSRACEFSHSILRWIIQQIESIVKTIQSKFFYWVGRSNSANERWGTFGALLKITEVRK